MPRNHPHHHHQVPDNLIIQVGPTNETPTYTVSTLKRKKVSIIVISSNRSKQAQRVEEDKPKYLHRKEEAESSRELRIVERRRKRRIVRRRRRRETRRDEERARRGEEGGEVFKRRTVARPARDCCYGHVYASRSVYSFYVKGRYSSHGSGFSDCSRFWELARSKHANHKPHAREELGPWPVGPFGALREKDFKSIRGFKIGFDLTMI